MITFLHVSLGPFSEEKGLLVNSLGCRLVVLGIEGGRREVEKKEERMEGDFIDDQKPWFCGRGVFFLSLGDGKYQSF
jgi:hypothetical protein